MSHHNALLRGCTHFHNLGGGREEGEEKGIMFCTYGHVGASFFILEEIFKPFHEKYPFFVQTQVLTLFFQGGSYGV